MRNPGNKTCAILAAGLLAFAVGCAAPVGYAKDDPIFGPTEYSYWEDGSRDATERIFRLPFDHAGAPYPNPRQIPIEDRRLRECGSLLQSYFAADPQYDPAKVSMDLARRINDECRKDSATLIILIHGMDNCYAEARRTFEAARLRINSLYHRQPLVFLEIYWDAHCGNALAVWGEARPGSKWVGLGLRPLLSALDHSTPVRILTHSRGSSVACAALWNVPLREGASLDAAYEKRQKEHPLPCHPDLRVGMLVPAMPEEDFEACVDLTSQDLPDRVILGINEDDPALNKGPLGPRFLGSTRAGCRLSAFTDTVAPSLNRERTVAYAVDLSASRDHDFKDYLFRRAVKERFLPLLLEPLRPGAVASER